MKLIWNSDFFNSNFQSHPALSENVKQQTEETVKWCQELKDQVTVMENRIRFEFFSFSNSILRKEMELF